MILYKYLSLENAWRVISNKKLRFTPPSELNDPFEMRPNYESLGDAPEVQEQLTDENLRNVMETEIGKQLDQMPEELFQVFPRELFSGFFGDVVPTTKDLAPGLFAEVTRLFGESIYSELQGLVGVLCLSERNDISLMWAHYAEAHRGLVLGFDSDSPFFERRLHEKDDFGHLEKVSYRANTSVQIIHLEDGQEILYAKNPEWSYEKEWRMVLPLQDANEIIEKEDVRIHLFQFPPEALQEVIFGCRVAVNQRTEILSYMRAEKGYNHVQVFSADLDEQSRAITLKEIPIKRKSPETGESYQEESR